MSALMDMLADASVAAAAHEEEAASILQGLFSARRESSEHSASDAEQTATNGDADADDAPRSWTREEDELLRRLTFAKAGPQAKARGAGKSTPAPTLETREWRQIAEHFDDRSAMQCAHRFQKVINPDNVKGACARFEYPSSVLPPRGFAWQCDAETGAVAAPCTSGQRGGAARTASCARGLLAVPATLNRS